MNILIVRSSANKVNRNGYNLQEIGLGKALVDKGINCDIVYSNLYEESHKEQIYKASNGHTLNILWTKLTFKIFNNGIYKELFKKDFFNGYDYIILSDYIQFMNYKISCIVPDKCILYQGPYRDIRKFVQYFYDILFLEKFKKNIKLSFTKSNLAKMYLEDKGFSNIHTIGVGLDIENIQTNQDSETDSMIQELQKRISNRQVLLYIGVLEERRNIIFMLDMLKQIIQSDNNIVLLIVGNGKNRDKYLKYIKDIDVESNVIYIEKITQNQLISIHNLADIFLLPSKYEIFGMVLLESMYLGTPVISSLNGGSSMLIDTGETGYVVELDIAKWKNATLNLLSNRSIRNLIAENSKKKLLNEFRWNEVAKRLIQKLPN